MVSCQQKCIGFDVRVLTDSTEKLSDIAISQFRLKISGDPNILACLPETEKLINSGVWKEASPIGLLTSEQVLNDHFNEVFKNNSVIKLCLACSDLVFSVLNERYSHKWLGSFPSIESIKKNNKWKFSGWDILDLNGLISGIYILASDSAMKLDSSSLNDVGLFNSARDAAIYAEALGVKVPTHAPFVVTGIYINDGK